jgi:hypothetical protein
VTEKLAFGTFELAALETNARAQKAVLVDEFTALITSGVELFCGVFAKA